MSLQCFHYFKKDTSENQIIVLNPNHEFLIWSLPSTESELSKYASDNLNPFHLFCNHYMESMNRLVISDKFLEKDQIIAEIVKAWDIAHKDVHAIYSNLVTWLNNANNSMMHDLDDRRLLLNASENMDYSKWDFYQFDYNREDSSQDFPPLPKTQQSRSYGNCPDCNMQRTTAGWCKHCEISTLRENFCNWTTRDSKIDEFIRHTQLNVKENMDYLEWIDFDQFDLVKNKRSAIWMEGPRWSWDDAAQEWTRFPKTHQSRSYGNCPDCNMQRTTAGWCKHCDISTLRENFCNWTSGDSKIDEFIRHTQLNVKENMDYLEWIDFDQFDLVKNKRSAIWMEGPRWSWDDAAQEWTRFPKTHQSRSYGNCPDCNMQRTTAGWCKHCDISTLRENFCNWTSGDSKIDEFIRHTQLNAKENMDYLEWIDFDQFDLVKNKRSAIWMEGPRWSWDDAAQEWTRVPKTHQSRSYGNCPDCNMQRTTAGWCKHCDISTLRDNFCNWTSGDSKIDEFIRYTQLNAKENMDYLEWIDFGQFGLDKNINKRDVFGSMYSAIWMEGPRWTWDEAAQEWLKTHCPDCNMQRITATWCEHYNILILRLIRHTQLNVMPLGIIGRIERKDLIFCLTFIR